MALRGFPAAARRAAGYQLYRVQKALDPNDWKPLPTVGLGVCEIRIHTALEHRVLFVARFPEAVYVLHAFEKRTRKTVAREIALARKRFSDLKAWRRAQER